MEYAIAIAELCVTSLVALVLVLRHLAAMRATSGELVDLRTDIARQLSAADACTARIAVRIEEHETRLVHLSNRTQR